MAVGARDLTGVGERGHRSQRALGQAGLAMVAGELRAPGQAGPVLAAGWEGGIRRRRGQRAAEGASGEGGV
jgi:hypothetical protein